MAVKPIYAAQRKPDAVWIAAYRWHYANFAASYTFVAGTREYLGNALPFTERVHYLSTQAMSNLNERDKKAWFNDSVLAGLRRVPTAWSEDIEEHVRLSGNQERCAHLGHIIYTRDCNGENASAFSYYPRDVLGARGAPRLSYFLEAMAIHDLQTQGVLRISQTHTVTIYRERQLGRVGIPLKLEFDAGHWLKRMGHGIRQHLACLKTEEGKRTVQIIQANQRMCSLLSTYSGPYILLTESRARADASCSLKVQQLRSRSACTSSPLSSQCSLSSWRP